MIYSFSYKCAHINGGGGFNRVSVIQSVRFYLSKGKSLYNVIIMIVIIAVIIIAAAISIK